MNIALIIYILFLLGYLFFSWAILWHMKKHLPIDKTSKFAIRLFIIGSIVLISLSLFLFFMVPWEEIIKPETWNIKQIIS